MTDKLGIPFFTFLAQKPFRLIASSAPRQRLITNLLQLLLHFSHQSPTISVVRSFNGYRFKYRLLCSRWLSESFSCKGRLFREKQNYSKAYDASFVRSYGDATRSYAFLQFRLFEDSFVFLPSFSFFVRNIERKETNHTEMRGLHCLAVKRGETATLSHCEIILCVSFVHFLSLSVSRAPPFPRRIFTTFHSANDTVKKATIELHFYR